MNYLSGALRYVAGNETQPTNLIPRYIDRLKTSALPHDRRSAILQLTQAAKQSPNAQAQIGELGIKIFYAVLEQDVEYDDTIIATLNLLIAICATLDSSKHDQNQTESIQKFEKESSNAAACNIDVFLGLPNALSLLLALLDKQDFYLKFGTIELLTAMAANSRHTLQAAMLEAPQAVARICDLLDDSHRHVRSNAVLLLSTLCDQSPEICKIVAFAGVLEKLFLLIETVLTDPSTDPNLQSEDDLVDEDSLEAAIVVQDVLLVLRNLIRGTPSTRTFFRDSNSLPRLVQLVRRSANDTGLLNIHPNDNAATNNAPVGVKSAIEKQARKNLIIALQCIYSLVKGSDQECILIKNELAATTLFKTLVSLAFLSTQVIDFSQADKIPENLLHVKIAALKTISLLVRGHDDFRNMFTSTTYAVSMGEEASTPQVVALRSVLSNPSAAVRIAAYNALRESFVVDAGLDLPSSALLNALTASSNTTAYTPDHTRNLSHGSLSSMGAESTPSTNVVIYIAESLKDSLVSWPNETDAAGVFYAASIISWVVERVQGARERLLSSYANGGALLPQIIRVLSKLEREKGPPEVRIALFSLACLWLHGSRSAVSTFLSFAMHLPMIVDTLKSTGSRGDIAEPHTRGLSSVLLGVCLQAADASSDVLPESGFLSGGGGSSTIISREKIIDVIRNRIGVTVFTASLDDLRSTREYNAGANDSTLWKTAENLISQEEKSGFISRNGSLGHSSFYSQALIQVVDDVYQNIGTKVLDLMSEPVTTSDIKGRPVNYAEMNGHSMAGSEATTVQQNAIADSARDEVINSYKEFIRSQDERYTAASRQIEELSNALREAQAELESQKHSVAIAHESESIRKLTTDLDKTKAEKEELEILYEEKNADFAALSEALAALEAEQASKDENVSAENIEAISTELQQLRAQNVTIKESLERETQKTVELGKQNVSIQEEVEMREMEIEAKDRQIQALQSNSQPQVVEALQWKTRAEVAETKLQSRQQLFDSTLNEKYELEEKVRLTESSRDDALSRMNVLEQRFEEKKSELERIRETRKRELQVSRESSAMQDAATKNEILSLQQQLSNVQTALVAEKAKKASGPNPEELNAYQSLQEGHQALLSSFEQMKTELIDSRQATVQWQKRAEIVETEKERQADQIKRWVDYGKSLETQIRSLNDAMVTKSQESESISTRVAELEQQCNELDELRKQGEDEAKHLKEQLSARTEQTIRLSGQLYELEEAKVKLEEEVNSLQSKLGEQNSMQTNSSNETNASVGNDDSSTGIIQQLQSKLSAIEQELEVSNEALAESKDRENLSRAHASDREAVLLRAQTLETQISEIEEQKAQLQEQVDHLTAKLVTASEAEEGRKSLAEEVLVLKAELNRIMSTNHEISQTHSQNATDEKESAERIATFQNKLEEQELQLQELKSSLSNALDSRMSAEREREDFEKQVAELNTMLSVLQDERNALASEAESLRTRIDQLPDTDTQDTNLINKLETKLEDAEQKYEGASKELSSLVDACKVSEKESIRMQNEIKALDENLAKERAEAEALRRVLSDSNLRNEVQNFVNLLVQNASVSTFEEYTVYKENSTQLELDKLTEQNKVLTVEIQELQTELENLNIIRQEHEESRRLSSDQERSIASLTTETASLRTAIDGLEEELAAQQPLLNQRKQLILDAENTKGIIENLTQQKDAALLKATELEASFARVSVTSPSSDTRGEISVSSPSRMEELEIALRDAAKTVSTTNKELLAAQALLVELSADKTTIRIELDEAKKQIVELSERLTSNLQKGRDPALSEISEVDPQSTTDVPDEPVTTLSENNIEADVLKAVHADAENLRMALGRTIGEADNASTLLKKIASQVALVESKLVSSETSLEETTEAKQKLYQELKECKKVFAQEKQTLLQERNSLEKQLVDQKENENNTVQSLNSALDNLKISSQLKNEEMDQRLTELASQLQQKTEECNFLKEEQQRTQVKVDEYIQQIGELEASKSSSATSIAALNQEVASLKKNLNEINSQNVELREQITLQTTELNETKEQFKSERIASREEHQREVEDLQDEIDKLQTNLENLESSMRHNEASLNSKILSLTTDLEKKSAELTDCKSELHRAEEQIAKISDEKYKRENELTNSIHLKDNHIEKITEERDNTKALLDQRSEENQHLTKCIAEHKSEISLIKKELDESKENENMLEEEKQDLDETIESLEQTSKRLREQLTNKDTEVSKALTKIDAYQNESEKMTEHIQSMKENINIKESSIARLETEKSALEEVEAKLKKKLEETELSQTNLEQDNRDLRAWVADLERQATELQSAATDFEDVEQSLRDALESQRYAADQNTKLADEMRVFKETLATAEAKARNAHMEKTAAEAARDSSQRRANELEDRIREIREEHVSRLASSEAIIHEKAKRCAELESRLASAERSVAESGTFSDELFGVRTKLKQRDEDIETLKDRAEFAERREEILEQELAKVKGEVSDAKEFGNSDAYRTLEAEHNELLICLADMELECSSLREELGRE